MNHSYLKTLAANYNCGAYGAGDFGDGSTCQTTTPPNDGGLTNTGMNTYIPLAVGIVLVAAAVVLLVATLKRRNKQSDK